MTTYSQTNRRALLALPLAFALLACACGSAGNPDDQTDGGSTSDPHGPVFLSFGSNVTALTEGETVNFTAVLTDPDGIDDLIGGALESPDGALYGAFATSGQEGAYTLAVTWDQMNQLKDITFDDSEERSFVARFFDEAGHQSTKTLTVTFTCKGIAACAGRCSDLSVDKDHCGQCGRQCDACDDSRCSTQQSSTARVSCEDLCGDVGAVCANNCPDITPTGIYHCSEATCVTTRPCEQVPESYIGGSPFTRVECCCAQ